MRETTFFQELRSWPQTPCRTQTRNICHVVPLLNTRGAQGAAVCGCHAPSIRIAISRMHMDHRAGQITTSRPRCHCVTAVLPTAVLLIEAMGCSNPRATAATQRMRRFTAVSRLLHPDIALIASAMLFAEPRPKLVVCVASTGRTRSQATWGVAWWVSARLAAIDLLGAASVVPRARPSTLETLGITCLFPARLACPIPHFVIDVIGECGPRC